MSASLASGRVPESSYGEHTSPNYAHEISNPQRPFSYDDEYNSSRDNSPPTISSLPLDVHTTRTPRSLVFSICSCVTFKLPVV